MHLLTVTGRGKSGKRRVQKSCFSTNYSELFNTIFYYVFFKMKKKKKKKMQEKFQLRKLSKVHMIHPCEHAT